MAYHIRFNRFPSNSLRKCPATLIPSITSWRLPLWRKWTFLGIRNLAMATLVSRTISPIVDLPTPKRPPPPCVLYSTLVASFHNYGNCNSIFNTNRITKWSHLSFYIWSDFQITSKMSWDMCSFFFHLSRSFAPAINSCHRCIDLGMNTTHRWARTLSVSWEREQQ